MKNLIVQVRVYKGEVNHDSKGNVKSPNQLIKLHYGIKEWMLFLRNINQMGWTRVDVVKCLDGNKKDMENGMFTHPEIDIPEGLEQEIKVAMKGQEKKLTPEQEKIKELEAKIEALAAGQKSAKKEGKAPAKKTTKKDNTPDINEELEAARDEYLEVFGEKPHHMKQLAKLNAEIKAKLAE